MINKKGLSSLLLQFSSLKIEKVFLTTIYVGGGGGNLTCEHWSVTILWTKFTVSHKHDSDRDHFAFIFEDLFIERATIRK